MTRQNRVTPLGDLVAEPARGLVYGNRGCLHDAAVARVITPPALLAWLRAARPAPVPVGGRCFLGCS